MANVTVLNADAGLSAKTLLNGEDAQDITGLKTFNRSTNAPFAVPGGAAKVDNLDADLLDGQEATEFLREASAGTKSSGDLTFNDDVNATFGTGGDADIRYDGTDLIIDTQVVGTGALSLTKGQIKFPAAQNASTNVNTLDDYEEGSWTPVIGGAGGTSGQTYGTQGGRYVKIGRLVYATFNAALTAKGTITGAVQIQGLPFTSEAIWSLTSLYFYAMATNWISLHGLNNPSTTSMSVVGIAAATTGNASALSTTDIGNTTQMLGTLVYMAAN